MKKLIAVAGLGVAAITALVVAGSANASEMGFIQNLNNNGISVCGVVWSAMAHSDPTATDLFGKPQVPGRVRLPLLRRGQGGS
jgi:hypothetical protein